jgi:hydroxymethylglutaryl-CoA synthase
MKLKGNVGILSYGAYFPREVIRAEDISKAHGGDGSQAKQLGVQQKTVAAIDEDTITLSTMAGHFALEHLPNDLKHKVRQEIGALFIGSESHPYAVKPSGTVVKEALGLPEQMALADLQFACKAGTQSLQIVLSYVLSGMVDIGMAIGADTAQSKPGDILELTAAAGAAAYIVGKETSKTHLLAECLGTISIATDTPDFWRRPGQPYPEHAGRFSGEPGYFTHVTKAAKLMIDEMNMEPKDFAWCVFHTPNAKFPKTAAAKLGFSADQLAPSLIVPEVGNTYAAASLLALAAVLDQAKPDQYILVVSYGSGSGSDAFVFKTTNELTKFQQRQQLTVRQQLTQRNTVDYQEYQRRQQHLH